MSDLTFYIARRYILSKGSHRFLSFISVLTVLGVAIGIAAMIIVLSIINGFEDQLRERFLAANAHIIMFQFPDALQDYDREEQKVRSSFLDGEMKGVSPFVHMETMATYGTGFFNVLVRGVDLVKRESVQSLREFIKPVEAYKKLFFQSTQDVMNKIPLVIIGSGLARMLDVKEGEVLHLVSPHEDSFLGLYKEHRVVGIYDSGLSHYDDKLVIMSLRSAQRLFDMGNTVTGLEIGLVKPWQSQRIQQRLSQKFPNFRITHWQEYNKKFFEAIEYERMMIGLLVALVALVGGFNILTTLFVSVFQKERDISLLRSIGCSKGDILWIFVKQGFLMGVIGCGLGMILAFVFCVLLEKYQIITLPDVYGLATIPVEYSPLVYGVTCLVAVCISTVAGLLPALTASGHDLSSSLKYRN